MKTFGFSEHPGSNAATAVIEGIAEREGPAMARAVYVSVLLGTMIELMSSAVERIPPEDRPEGIAQAVCEVSGMIMATVAGGIDGSFEDCTTRVLVLAEQVRAAADAEVAARAQKLN